MTVGRHTLVCAGHTERSIYIDAECWFELLELDPKGVMMLIGCGRHGVVTAMPLEFILIF